MRLITLEENDRRSTERVTRMTVPNGVACPECGAEMEDDVSVPMLLTHPPLVSVKCPKCGHGTLRRG